MQDGLSIGKCVVWRKLAPKHERCLHLITIALSIAAYLRLLTRENDFRIELFGHFALSGVLWSLGGAALLYFLLDKGLDPILERAFPVSEAGYQETLRTLSAAPVASLLQVCVLAPVMEEILMRGYVLQGLSISYGGALALLVSSLLFALLHFNMVQTLSALVCGLVIGLLYWRTGSLFCCILTHAGYNFLSYITMILPLYREQ